MKIAAGAVILALIAGLIALAVQHHQRMTTRCHRDGGTVTTDTDREWNKKKQRWETHTEHECVRAGVELYEW